MFLIKNPHGVYYTRMPLPKLLRDQDLQFCIRASLQTKERKVAISRNLAMAAHLRELIAQIDTRTDTSPRSFQKWIRNEIAVFRQQGFCFSPSHQSVSTPRDFPAPSELPPSGMPLKQALDAFLTAKACEGIQNKSIQQLRLRVGDLITWMNDKKLTQVDQITPVLTQEYRNQLLQQPKSHKTKTNYLNSAKQFFGWCLTLGYCSTNPLAGITAGKKAAKNRADTERTRWSKAQVLQLFTCLRVKQQHKYKKLKPQDFWVPLLCLYGGLRPSEACQLKSRNIQCIDGIWCMKIEAGEADGTLKTENAYRTVPLHSALLQHGFLDYVTARKTHKYLFDDKPFGPDADWSHNLLIRYARHLTHAGIVGKGRPTVYGLRHTFIDELQQADVAEHIVAELVGHSKQGITFGRYGKRVNLSLLREKIELFPADFVQLPELYKKVNNGQ